MSLTEAPEIPGILDVIATLLVLDFEVPADVITHTLRVTPTATWKVEDKVHPKAGHLHNYAGWRKDSPVDRSNTTPQGAVAALLDLFPDPHAFSRLPDNAEVQLTLTLYGRNHRPYAYLPAPLLGRIAAIGAHLDVDTYDLTSADDGRS